MGRIEEGEFLLSEATHSACHKDHVLTHISIQWHDIKREKKWDEISKKWKKKWKKEKGKKYKGNHMKKVS